MFLLNLKRLVGLVALLFLFCNHCPAFASSSQTSTNRKATTIWHPFSRVLYEYGNVYVSDDSIKWQNGPTSRFSIISETAEEKLIVLFDGVQFGNTDNITYRFLRLTIEGPLRKISFYRNNDEINKDTPQMTCYYEIPHSDPESTGTVLQKTKKARKNGSSPENTVSSEVIPAYRPSVGHGVTPLKEELPTLRKLIAKENKVASKIFVNGKKPRLPRNPIEEASVIQMAINNKRIIPYDGLVGECAQNNNSSRILCNMYFPAKRINNVVEQSDYVRQVNQTTRSVANSIKTGQRWPYVIVGMAEDSYGRFVATCSVEFIPSLNTLIPACMDP